MCKKCMDLRCKCVRICLTHLIVQPLPKVLNLLLSFVYFLYIFDLSYSVFHIIVIGVRVQKIVRDKSDVKN